MPSEWMSALEAYPLVRTSLALVVLVLAAFIANWITKRVLLRGLQRLTRSRQVESAEYSSRRGVIPRLANAVPAVVLWAGVSLVPGLPEAVVTVVRNTASAFIVLTVALAIGAALDLANTLYQRREDAALRPIKGYLQIVKIAVFAIAAILMIAALIDRSPVILLSGLGAMAAVLMLIFQDTLLSLVASVQIASNDIARVGDWIEMPQLNVDGFVIDLALHTAKVQNWDKTISTIPTRKLVSESVKNWRGMQESGGRRIKRSIYLDQHSVRFLSDNDLARLQRFFLLDGYLQDKQKELADWNAQLKEWREEPANTRRVTNIGTFRAYVDRYLRNHPGINQDMIMMVRQLAPGPQGVPIELYCFTSTVAWVGHEATQGDIFDHLLAILPEFGLRVFQQPSGADLRLGLSQAVHRQASAELELAD